MNATPLARRAERRARNRQRLDMNLVALIDIFTILLFFLLSSATELETLVIPRAVDLPHSSADATPRPTVVVLVNAQEIVVDGRTVARSAEVLASEAESIEALRSELLAVRARPGASATVTLMGDKDIPYRLLRKVMTSCAEAEFVDIAFAVRTQLAKTQVPKT